MSNLIVFRNLALGKVERNGVLQYYQRPLETREFDPASFNSDAFCTVRFVLVYLIPRRLLQILTGFAVAWYLRLCELTALL